MAYAIFNSKFFGGTLPPRLAFIIKSQPTKSYIGTASYVYDNYRHSVKATAITLNAANTLTLHEWLEVVLHEMIHVLDYETNPQHFLGYMRRSYDAHGYWFMEQGKKYEKWGFHVQRYCNADFGVNTDDRRIQNRLDSSVFLYMQGKDRPLIMKMSRSSKDKNLVFILDRIKRGSSFGIGVKEIKVMTSSNPKIAMLTDLRMRNGSSKISWWWFTDDFKKKYGPFKVEDTVKVPGKRRMNEDAPEEQPFERKKEEQEPEEVIEEIKDGIGDVEEVKDIGNDKFIVTIP